MRTEIKGKEITGYSYADGTHWHWGDTDVAVIDETTSEIEWLVRKNSLPEEVIQAIRDRKPKAAGKWMVEAKRISYSATQGEIQIQINGKPLITFGDDKIMRDGEWVNKTPDEELGRLVCSAFWPRLDDIYHYSDKAKKLFYPNEDDSNEAKIRVCKRCGGVEFATNYMAPLECVVDGSGNLVWYLSTDIERSEEACSSRKAPRPFSCLGCGNSGKTLEDITTIQGSVDICLIEKPCSCGLNSIEFSRLSKEFGDREVIPVEFEAKEHECSAMGFITMESADALGYDYRGVAEYIASILDDMDLEHEDGMYEFQGIKIKLTR